MRLVSALACVLLVAGCAMPWSEDETDYGNPAALMDAIGCDTVTEEEPMMFTVSTDTCKLGTDTVTVNWFNTNEARDRYVDVGMSNGAVYVIGDNWAVECPGRALQQAVAASTKGEAV